MFQLAIFRAGEAVGATWAHAARARAETRGSRAIFIHALVPDHHHVDEGAPTLVGPVSRPRVFRDQGRDDGAGAAQA